MGDEIPSKMFDLAENLMKLAESVNVALFCGFRPVNGQPSFVGSNFLQNSDAFHESIDMESAVKLLFERSHMQAVSVRSHPVDDATNRSFDYWIEDPATAISLVYEYARQNCVVVVNEGIPVETLTCAGVVQDEIIEFAPMDTPRCVELAGVCSLPRKWGENILRYVFGIGLDLESFRQHRVEFSMHKFEAGSRNNRVLIWEVEPAAAIQTQPLIWPNRFSRFLGDKAFGLLIAEQMGLRIPRTRYFHREFGIEFAFGIPTNSKDHIDRICPTDQINDQGSSPTLRNQAAKPLSFLTQFEGEKSGQNDPFKGVAYHGFKYPSVLRQDWIHPHSSGKTATRTNGDPLHEGVSGSGFDYMLGHSPPEALNQVVVRDLDALFWELKSTLGDVEFEWVHDGSKLWVVQLNQSGSLAEFDWIYKGTPDKWINIDGFGSYNEFRKLVKNLNSGIGVLVEGRFGLTSHKAGLLRSSQIPSKFST